MKQILCFLGMLAILASQAVASGDHVWSHGFGGSAAGDSVTVNAVAADTSGNAFMVGQMSGTVTLGGANLTSAGDNDVFVAKFDSSGAYQWSMRYGSTGSDIAWGVGTDSSGNIYVTGQFSGTVSFGGSNLISNGANLDIFVAKYSSAGAYMWSQRIGGTGHDVANAISVMADGTFAITGYFGNFGNGQADFGGGTLTTAGGPDIFVAKYTSAGAFIWAQRAGGTGGDFGLGVAIDVSGNVAATGYFQGSFPLGCGFPVITSAGLKDGFVLDYATNGSLAWARRFGGTSDDQGAAVAVDSRGSVLVFGTFSQSTAPVNFGGSDHASSGAGNDLFLVKYTGAGSFSWDGVWGTTNSIPDIPKAVAVDSSGNVGITGNMQGPTDLGGGPLCGPSCNTSTSDTFVAKFSASGTHVFSHRYWNFNYDERGNGIAFDGSGNAIVGGQYQDQEDLGGGALTPNGSAAINKFYGFLAKFTP